MKHLKRFSVLGFVVLISLSIIFISAVLAQDVEKEKKQAEEIKPPIDEKWYEEGDEEVYKFEINPITPKEGITGGILIYYGHFVKPPYKVELVPCNSKCYEKDLKYRLLINNLPIIPGPRDFLIRLNKASLKKAEEKHKMTKEEIEALKERDKISENVRRDVKRYWDKLIKKYDANTEEGKKKIKEEIEKYIANHPKIEGYKIFNFREFEFFVPETKVDIFSGWIKITISPFMFLPEEKKREIIRRREEYFDSLYFQQKEDWEYDLGRNYTIAYSEIRVSTTLNSIKKISSIISSNNDYEYKVKKAYKITEDILLSKLLVYNFDPRSFNNYMGENHD